MSRPRPPAWILDTNILVHLLRGKAAGRDLDQRFGLTTSAVRPSICIVTVGECLSLAKQFGWGAQKQKALRDLLNQLPVVDINEPSILDRYAEIDAVCKAAGNKLKKNDLWIAASAAVLGAAVLTCDRDFSGIPPGLVDIEFVHPETLPAGP